MRLNKAHVTSPTKPKKQPKGEYTLLDKSEPVFSMSAHGINLSRMGQVRAVEKTRSPCDQSEPIGYIRDLGNYQSRSEITACAIFIIPYEMYKSFWDIDLSLCDIERC